MGQTSPPLLFTVRRGEPELLRPAKPTPRETKLLSDVDDQVALRFHFPVIQFYKHNPAMHRRDPAAVIRRAVAETLVYYYPFAGRLKEGPNRKLAVDCTGEGVLFVEGDADVRMAEFGDGDGGEIRPPFRCVEELLPPVTRLQCDGFILAFRVHHSMCDAVGFVQFMFAVAEIARGATTSPTITPVWERHILNARSPPRVTYIHNEYDKQTTTNAEEVDTATFGSFSFGPTEISSLRRHVPPRAPRPYSQFEIIAACLWKCRTAALRPDPGEEMRMILPVNTRGKLANPPLPEGYYGNTQVFPAAVAPAGELCRNPLGFALNLLREAKSKVTEEYIKSVADLMVLEGRRPDISMTKCTCILSDVSRAGFGAVDFGWGEAVYGGLAGADPTRMTNYCMAGRNGERENEIVLMISLPTAVIMERFLKELDNMLHGDQIKKFSYILSTL
ncbi:Benzyl alcohol O-benzoyltransferase [Linum perenne]